MKLENHFCLGQMVTFESTVKKKTRLY